METKKAHAHIWSKVSQFDRQAVLYAFRFDNGKTKFGKSTNIMSRTGDHLAHGITGCVSVTVVRVEANAIDALEQLMLEHVATKHKRLANEVFVSSANESEDERMIRHAIGGGLPAVVNVVVASLQANCFSSSGWMRSGLSQTSSFNFQLRVDRDQRRGLRCLAAA
jgi:hypothetical protein